MSSDAIIETIARHITPATNKLQVGVLASGSGSNLQALIDFSDGDECLYEISCVISNTPGSRALDRAQQKGIGHRLVDHRNVAKPIFENRLLNFLQEYNVELVVLAGFMRVLSVSFLNRFHNRVINLHPSLLPEHRGLDAINKAMKAGDEHTGCTVHLVDAGLDTGPIIAQSSCPIFHHDDLEQLTKRIQQLEHALLPIVVNNIARASFDKHR